MNWLDLAKNMGLNPRKTYQKLSTASLKAALAEQQLTGLVEYLREIVPNVHDQYTDPNFASEFNDYWELKTRGLHAFQVEFLRKAIQKLELKDPVIVDIGDSSGNHGLYMKTILKDKCQWVSVNLDPVAVEKTKTKGLESYLVRAEEVRLERKVDLFISFQMVEHLLDPSRFLHNLATSNKSEHLLFTVPLRDESQVGLHELRRNWDHPLTPEGTHIFELSPEDWTLLARFSGWKLIDQQSYFQYPKFHPLALTKNLWKKHDFTGFWGGLFQRDLKDSERYQSW